MRKELEFAVRAWARPLPVLGVAGLVAAGVLAGYAALSSYSTTIAYILAFVGAGLALAVLSSVEGAAWCLPRRSLDLTHLGASLGASLAGVLPLRIAAGTAQDGAFGPAVLLGCLQLAALALVVRRAPAGPAVRAVILLVVAIVVPALVPVLRPVLDASPSFHVGHFPGWTAALAPILSLIVLASALPSPVRAAAGNSTA